MFVLFCFELETIEHLFFKCYLLQVKLGRTCHLETVDHLFFNYSLLRIILHNLPSIFGVRVVVDFEVVGSWLISKNKNVVLISYVLPFYSPSGH
jgi:hypothetical protein